VQGWVLFRLRHVSEDRQQQKRCAGSTCLRLRICGFACHPEKVPWPVSPSRFPPHLNCPAHTSTSLQQFAGPDTVARSCKALRLGQHNQRETANCSRGADCPLSAAARRPGGYHRPSPPLKRSSRGDIGHSMLNGHTTPSTDDAGVPGPAREGRELQRYSASGERLVAGCASSRGYEGIVSVWCSSSLPKPLATCRGALCMRLRRCLASQEKTFTCAGADAYQCDAIQRVPVQKASACC